MMSMNVKDYVKIYNNFLDVKFCKTTVKKLKKQDWTKHQWYNPDDDEHFESEDELSVCYAQMLEETEIINKKI